MLKIICATMNLTLPFVSASSFVEEHLRSGDMLFNHNVRFKSSVERNPLRSTGLKRNSQF